MARTVIEQSVSQQSFQSWVKIIVLGALAGVAYQFMTFLIHRYAIEPWACAADAVRCGDSSVMAGNITLVIIGVAAVFVAIRLNLYRPLAVIAAATVTLWGLSSLTAGLWWLEALSWTVVLFALTYALYAWIVRHLEVIPMIIVSVVVAVLTRVIPLLY